jgi:thymidylate synthase
MSRMYADFPEAQNEITRDLAELGTNVHTETMQDKDIKDDPDFMTKELTNYIYTVLKPNYEEIEGTHDEWVQQEWQDRLVGELNPGHSYLRRREVWDQFLEGPPNRFSYTYSQRMGGKHLDKLIDELLAHPHSRQLWLPVWWTIDEERRGDRRVPCSLGYWFVQREGAIHQTYVMRSCDFYTHYANDVALASMLLHYVAKMTDYKVGTFTHFLGSLHVYAKDVAHVF